MNTLVWVCQTCGNVMPRHKDTRPEQIPPCSRCYTGRGWCNGESIALDYEKDIDQINELRRRDAGTD